MFNDNGRLVLIGTSMKNCSSVEHIIKVASLLDTSYIHCHPHSALEQTTASDCQHSILQEALHRGHP